MKWLVATPGLLMALVFGASGASALLSGQPLVWPVREITLTDAVAMGDTSEVVRQVRDGADPNARVVTPTGPRSGQTVPLTPLEAAVAAHRIDMVTLLEDYGARMDEATVRALRCFADRLGEERTRRYLAGRTSEPLSCDGIATPW